MAKIKGVREIVQHQPGPCGATTYGTGCPHCGSMALDTRSGKGNMQVKRQSGGCEDLVRIAYICGGCPNEPVLIVHNHKGMLDVYWLLEDGTTAPLSQATR